MKNNLEVITEFVFGLQLNSKSPLKGLELKLPIEPYNTLVKDLESTIGWIRGNDNIKDKAGDSFELTMINSIKIKISKQIS